MPYTLGVPEDPILWLRNQSFRLACTTFFFTQGMCPTHTAASQVKWILVDSTQTYCVWMVYIP